MATAAALSAARDCDSSAFYRNGGVAKHRSAPVDRAPLERSRGVIWNLYPASLRVHDVTVAQILKKSRLGIYYCSLIN